jgi:RimJ/RimL family protein N-acetyltransferase
MKKQTVLKGSNFILRPYRKNDKVSITKHANNKKMARDFSFPYPFTIKDAEKYIKSKINQPNEITSNFVIEIDGEAVGAIGFDLKQEFKTTIGYWLGERFWGKGITSEALKLVTDHAFKNLKKLRRVEGVVYSWNEASKKVLENNGYICEGLLRNYVKRGSKLINVYMYAKIKQVSKDK